MHKCLILLTVFLSSSGYSYCQNGTLAGNVIDRNTGNAITYANVYIEGTTIGSVSDEKGSFEIRDIPFGNYTLIVSLLGFAELKENIKISKPFQSIQLVTVQKESIFDQVVVTGTKTFQSRFSSPVIVQVLESESLDKIQACNLAEGLKFQSGLRVETDCQTCNYTQLRINGLSGGYSQILINGRPIFSALNSLYGLEQIPSNMVDQIETVKGGGSALYGSNAIAGTVNILTKIPIQNSYQIAYTYQNINGRANDHFVNTNGTILNKKKNFGAAIFFNSRTRDWYDHNDDNFSELPALKNNSIGTNFIYRPKENQKLELSLNYLHEYRYGGEQVKKTPHLALQAEERTHQTFMGSADYQYNFNKDKSALILYFASQYTHRDHYTGIFPDGENAIAQHLENPPYGTSQNFTINTGAQFNHKLKKFLVGSNVLTAGIDLSIDDIYDAIPAYNYQVDQKAILLGTFVQSDWKITPKINLLSGLRMDKSNFVDQLIFNPRFAFMYKTEDLGEIRLSWGQGFRAPQAFDADLHIAFAGGGISRVRLSDDLVEERSHSVSASYNYNKAFEKYIIGFTIDGFYTRLKQAFFLNPIGEDEFGQVFEKQNGSGAKVYGGNIDFRFNYNKLLQFEAGLTIQRSLYDDAVQYIPNINPQRKFMRAPNAYGYTVFTMMPSKKLYMNINAVFTGQMTVAHFAGAVNQTIDEVITSRVFNELGYKIAYTFPLPQIKSKMELFGGIKNVFNAYQDDFDLGKNRDSNFVYGPATPRTFFIGLRIKS